MKHIMHVKYILPTDRYINQLPDYSAFGRKKTLRINPDYIPDLHWKLANTYHNTSIGYAKMQHPTISVQYITVETLSYAKSDKCGEWCRTALNAKMSTSQSKREPTICSLIPIT